MKAQIIKSFGEADVFEAAELADPTPGAGEVVVKLGATSVNPVDWKLRRHGPAFAPELPAVLGCDIAGTVVSVGAGVMDFAAGDEVWGCGGGVNGMNGTYAEMISTDAALLARKPASLSMREAAALPLVTITAWEGLERAGVGAGDTVLVHGGAGGVGHVVIQLAKALGAKVFATVSSDEKAALARELGADETINYHTETVEAYVARLTNGRGFDAVYDATGGSDLEASFEATRVSGQVISIVTQFEADLTAMHLKGLSLHVVFMLIPMLHNMDRAAQGTLMGAAATLCDTGKLKPLIDDEAFSLSQVSAAHEKLEGGRARGKIVIDIA